MKALLIGDIVGRPGRVIVERELRRLRAPAVTFNGLYSVRYTVDGRG